MPDSKHSTGANRTGNRSEAVVIERIRNRNIFSHEIPDISGKHTGCLARRLGSQQGIDECELRSLPPPPQCFREQFLVTIDSGPGHEFAQEHRYIRPGHLFEMAARHIRQLMHDIRREIRPALPAHQLVHEPAAHVGIGIIPKRMNDHVRIEQTVTLRSVELQYRPLLPGHPESSSRRLRCAIRFGHPSARTFRKSSTARTA